jgi:hypothetical protein
MLGLLVQVVIVNHIISELGFQFLSFDLCPLQVYHPLLSFELQFASMCYNTTTFSCIIVSIGFITQSLLGI